MVLVTTIIAQFTPPQSTLPTLQKCQCSIEKLNSWSFIDFGIINAQGCDILPQTINCKALDRKKKRKKQTVRVFGQPLIIWLSQSRVRRQAKTGFCAVLINGHSESRLSAGQKELEGNHRTRSSLPKSASPHFVSLCFGRKLDCFLTKRAFLSPTSFYLVASDNHLHGNGISLSLQQAKKKWCKHRPPQSYNEACPMILF